MDDEREKKRKKERGREGLREMYMYGVTAKEPENQRERHIIIFSAIQKTRQTDG